MYRAHGDPVNCPRIVSLLMHDFRLDRPILPTFKDTATKDITIFKRVADLGNASWERAKRDTKAFILWNKSSWIKMGGGKESSTIARSCRIELIRAICDWKEEAITSALQRRIATCTCPSLGRRSSRIHEKSYGNELTDSFLPFLSFAPCFILSLSSPICQPFLA